MIIWVNNCASKFYICTNQNNNRKNKTKTYTTIDFCCFCLFAHFFYSFVHIDAHIRLRQDKESLHVEWKRNIAIICNRRMSIDLFHRRIFLNQMHEKFRVRFLDPNFYKFAFFCQVCRKGDAKPAATSDSRGVILGADNSLNERMQRVEYGSMSTTIYSDEAWIWTQSALETPAPRDNEHWMQLNR